MLLIQSVYANSSKLQKLKANSWGEAPLLATNQTSAVICQRKLDKLLKMLNMEVIC
jgi:hypothetical protein